MRFKVLAAILFVAAIATANAAPIAGVSAVSNGAPTGSPVQIESCTIVTPGDGATRTLADAATLYLGTRVHSTLGALAVAVAGSAASSMTRPVLRVELANETAKPVQLVRIKVVSPDDSVTYIRDLADFAPGDVLAHTFKSGVGLSGTSYFEGPPRADRCSVDFAVYADGSVWHNPKDYK